MPESLWRQGSSETALINVPVTPDAIDRVLRQLTSEDPIDEGKP